MDQHSTAGRAPSRVGITMTVPPSRFVAAHSYTAAVRRRIRAKNFLGRTWDS